MTLQRALSAVKRLSEEATPGEWKPALSSMRYYIVIADGVEWIAEGLDEADARLLAAAPDLAASVVEMAEALEEIALEYPETAIYTIPVTARAALASFAARFGSEP